MTATTAVLPATRRPAPDEPWAVADLDGHPTAAGYAYVATITFDGAAAGVVSDAGAGAVTVEMLSAARARLEAAAARYPFGGPVCDAVTAFVEVLVGEAAAFAQLDEASDGRTLVLDGDGTVLAFDGACDARMRARVAAEVPGGLVWSAGGWQQP